MTAAPAQHSLFALDRAVFDKAVNSLVGRAFPSSSVGFREEPNDGGKVQLKKLPDALANLGAAGSCPHCGLNAPDGCMVDICLACGAKSYAAGIVSQLRWNGSIAQHLFLQSIPYKAPKMKRRSSQAGFLPATSTAQGSSIPSTRSSPATGPQDASPPVTSQQAMAGISALGESPWSSSMDTSVGDQMSVFSLADAAASIVEIGPGGRPAAVSARDDTALDDFFAQLGDIPSELQPKSAGPQAAMQASPVDPAVRSVLSLLPDLSFLLADRLVIPEKDPGNFPPRVPPLAASTKFPAPAVYAPPLQDALPAATKSSMPMDDEWGDFA